jgi:hypothetical protein
VGVHCGIYKGSYNISNISYLNSPLLPFSFIPHYHHSWYSFSRSHFSIYIHLCTLFALYLPSPVLSPLTGTTPLPPSPPGRTCSVLLFANYVKEKKWHFCLFEIVNREFPCGTSVYICIMTWLESFISCILNCFTFLWWHNLFVNINKWSCEDK